MHAMHEFLMSIGCVKRGEDYRLEGFDHDFCLRFDSASDPETPASIDTVNLLIVPIPTSDWLADSILIKSNCRRHDIIRFISALGVQRFSDKVKDVFYATSSPLRLQKQEDN